MSDADTKKMISVDDELATELDHPSVISSVKTDAVKSGEDLEDYIRDIAGVVRDSLSQSISVLTPWFFNNMPQIYYQSTPRAEKVRHLSSIITGHIFESKQTLELWDREKTKVTYLGPGDDGDILLDMADKVKDLDFKAATLYFSKDRLLFLSNFFTSQYQEIDLKNKRISQKIDSARATLIQEFPNEAKSIEEYLNNLDNDFVVNATDLRIHITYRMYRYMLGHEGAHTMVAPFVNSNKVRFTLGFKHEKPGQLLVEILQLVQKYGFVVSRATIVSFKKSCPDMISIMHFSLADRSGNRVDINSIEMKRLHKALRTLAWVDVDEFTPLSHAPSSVSINAVNLLRSMACWAHLSLGKDNIYYYSSYKVHKTIIKYANFSEDLIRLFRLRFDPLEVNKSKPNVFNQACEKLLLDIQNSFLDDIEKEILRECVKFARYTLKTNYFMQTKTGLAFRLDPEILNKKNYPQVPYGIFFMVGRDYRMFHVRWKDIARGGVRVVMPRSSVEYETTMAGLFDEVYGLSYAQQLKNKDIPEGGSKAVLLLKPGGNRDKAVKGAVNALLDVLLVDDEAHESKEGQIISYFDKEEILYLGPDENITNELIEWIPAQAKRRGYKYADAFMSSKPGAGINHKQYGVTSEGVYVFVENMLNFMDINPHKQKFSVKITGGPDGDVAGNALNILYREYGENARIVAIGDGYGAAYDPDGLDWSELLRLFKESLAINHFSKAKLRGAKSFVVSTDTPENVRIRNELHYKVPADVFIPAGGRPYTVNDKTWSQFLVDGKPTCKAVVEGANIFFTSEARKLLQDAGVLIFKDSSANKTGVICSSFEIIASLTISESDFLALKKEYVDQVLVKLREKADLEAKLLLKEYMLAGGEKTLVELSLEVSKEINGITDSLLEQFTLNWASFSKDPLCQEIIFKHCPKVLVENFSERIMQKLPTPHKIAILSSYIASYIVYREGLGWMVSEPAEECFERSLYYIRQESLTQKLIDSVENANIENKDKIKKILQLSAARNLTEIHEQTSTMETE